MKRDFEHAADLGQAEGAAGDRRQDREGGKHVTAGDVDARRAQGATDLEIHDTVLIAAVFCMCNRYVDGLATWAPDDPDFYRQRAAIVADARLRRVHADIDPASVDPMKENHG